MMSSGMWEDGRIIQMDLFGTKNRAVLLVWGHRHHYPSNSNEKDNPHHRDPSEAPQVP